MEERDKKAICLMLNVNFDSGVDISTIIEDDDVLSEVVLEATPTYGKTSCKICFLQLIL